MIDYRAVLLSLIGSLTLCEHMGDVSNEVNKVLKMIDLDIDWDEWGELGDALSKMGVTTLYGTSLASEEEE